MSMSIKYPNITVKLTDEDGNAFAILGRVNKALDAQAAADEGQNMDPPTEGDWLDEPQFG